MVFEEPTMKNYSIFVIGLCLLFSAIGVSTQSYAFSKDDLKKLKKTKECERCDLSGAVIKLQQLTGAKLSGADLSGAVLTRVRLTKADLSGANLTGAKLANTQLDHANLTGANLTNVRMDITNVRHADFKDAILVGLITDDKTKEYFERAKNVPTGTVAVAKKKESGGLCTSELSVCKGNLEGALENKQLFRDRWSAIVKKESEYKQTIRKLKTEVRRNAQYKQLYNDATAQNTGLQNQEKARESEDQLRKVRKTWLENKLGMITARLMDIRYFYPDDYWAIVFPLLQEIEGELSIDIPNLDPLRLGATEHPSTNQSGSAELRSQFVEACIVNKVYKPAKNQTFKNLCRCMGTHIYRALPLQEGFSSYWEKVRLGGKEVEPSTELAAKLQQYYSYCAVDQRVSR